MSKTLFDKIWDKHEVMQLEDGSSVLYIDQHFIHEVTSPQAFNGLRERNLKVFRPERTLATADHNVPTINQHLPVKDPASANQLQQLVTNTTEFGIKFYDLGHERNGIVHVIGPELGITQPGMTIVCGDSHTSTHGAFGAIAFGIGTSEVEMVLATQSLIQKRPKTLNIVLNGVPDSGVTAKDIALYILSRMGTDGGTGYFIEFSGSAIAALSMEGRMSLCNMSIEMGARGGLISPDEKTWTYLKDRPLFQGSKDVALMTDPDARFDKTVHFDASDIEPMITYGTNPGMAIKINERIPELTDSEGKQDKSLKKALDYMALKPGTPIIDHKIDYIFLGSCTNGRIEDLRAFSNLVKGHKKASDVICWIVPGSRKVEEQAKAEGIDKILLEAGFELRQPGCSACLAMNEDKIPAGKYCVATSNRNFEGRQGPGSRTFLASPLTAAAAAITGKITDPRTI